MHIFCLQVLLVVHRRFRAKFQISAARAQQPKLPEPVQSFEEAPFGRPEGRWERAQEGWIDWRQMWVDSLAL